MNSMENPRLLARIAGVFYLIITVCALSAYMYVRGELIVRGDMAQTAANILAHEQLWRMATAASVIVALCNLPLGFILYELCKVVNRRVALLALLFIIASATLEAGNPVNYLETLLSPNTPEIVSAFDESQRQALARLQMRLFGPGFGVSLSFFAMFCILIGYLIFRSTFLPRILGVLFLVTRNMTRPLSNLARAADAVGRSVRHPPLAEEGVREIREATRAFNTMQDRLLRYLDSRTSVLAAMSHDLRTPLTRLRLRVESVTDPHLRARSSAASRTSSTML